MESRSYAAIAIAFLAVFVGIVIALIVWLTSGPPENRYYDIDSQYSVFGLQPEAAVRYKGLLVGHVKAIQLDPKDPQRVLVRIGVQPDAYITSATHAELGYQGLTGIAHISLVTEEGHPGKPLPTNVDQPARIPMQQNLIQYLSSAGKPDIKQAGEVLAGLRELLSAENRQNIAGMLAHLEEASRRVVALEQALSPTVKALPELADQSTQAIAQAHEAAAAVSTLADSSAQLVRELSGTRQQLDTAIERIARTAQDIDQLSRQLHRQPESVLYGSAPRRPGPGEPGFRTRGVERP